MKVKNKLAGLKWNVTGLYKPQVKTEQKLALYPQLLPASAQVKLENKAPFSKLN